MVTAHARRVTGELYQIRSLFAHERGTVGLASKAEKGFCDCSALKRGKVGISLRRNREASERAD